MVTRTRLNAILHVQYIVCLVSLFYSPVPVLRSTDVCLLLAAAQQLDLRSKDQHERSEGWREMLELHGDKQLGS